VRGIGCDDLLTDDILLKFEWGTRGIGILGECFGNDNRNNKKQDNCIQEVTK
jgi:hypothetical protein